jgi:hypothetical protein
MVKSRPKFVVPYFKMALIQGSEACKGYGDLSLYVMTASLGKKVTHQKMETYQ